jgi:hypothetical protein
MKIVVFDCDGVIINSTDEYGKYLWSKNIKKDLGLSPDQIRLIFSGDWSLVLKGLMDPQQYFKSVFTKLNIALSVDLFIEYWVNCSAASDRAFKLDLQGSLNTLWRYLKNI